MVLDKMYKAHREKRKINLFAGSGQCWGMSGASVGRRGRRVATRGERRL